MAIQNWCEVIVYFKNCDKKVTCAHNIICDVENAGANVIFDGEQTAELVIDGNSPFNTLVQ